MGADGRSPKVSSNSLQLVLKKYLADQRMIANRQRGFALGAVTQLNRNSPCQAFGLEP